MRRRTVLGGALAAGAALSMPAYLRAQSNKKLSILTWNIADQEALFKEEFAEFQKNNPGVEIEWLDKKGPEVPVFYQTQLVAGTPPDVINTQGALWVEYAAQRRPPRPYAIRPAGRRGRQALQRRLPQELGLRGEEFHGALLHHQDAALLQQDHVQGGGPRRAAEELRRDHVARPNDGERREDRPSDPQLRLAVLAASSRWTASSCSRRTSRRRPSTRRRRSRSWTSSRRATESGAINKISWTGRWVEPNGAFASGKVGMHHAHSPAFFFFKGQGPWVNADTLGVAQMPGGWSTPNSHGLGISKGSKNPELAFALVKHMTRTSGRASSSAAATSSPGMRPPTRPALERLQQGRSAHRTGARDAARAHRQDDRQLAAAVRRAAEGRLLARDPERGARPQGREDRAGRRGAGGQPFAEPERETSAGQRRPAVTGL